LGSRQHHNLLERGDQLEALDKRLTQALVGSGGLVLIAGEAGIGKSALVEAFCDPQREDSRILVGRCDPLSTPRPLGPLLDIAQRLGPRLEMLLGSGDRPAIVFAEALEQLRAEPTIVVFEDVHWADDATLDMLRFLGRRLAETQVLLLCTYRDDELGASHPLRRALGDLWGSPGVQRIKIPPLSEAAVESLVSGTDYETRTLYHLTGGNPFFVTEVLASGGTGIPEKVSDAVLARLGRMSPAGRYAMEVAAICGDPIEPALLSEGFGIDERALAECLRRGLLVESHARLAFRHQITRNAVLDSVPAPIRAQLHRRLVDRARRRGVMPDELASLAEHAERAGMADAVLEFAPAAAKWASRLGAHREAAAQFGRSVQFAQNQDPEIIAPLIEGWAYELHLLGRNDEAVNLCERAASVWHGVGNTAREADNIRMCSRSKLRLGDLQTSRELARRAIDMLERLPAGRELAWAYGNQAHIAQVCDEYGDCRDWSSKALALGKRLGDEELVVFSLNDKGMADLWLGDAAGQHDVLESARLATEYGFIEHVVRAQLNLAAYYEEVFEPLTAQGHLTAVVDYFPGAELEDMKRHVLALRAIGRVHTGEWAGAIEDATAAIRHGSGIASTASLALTTLAAIAAHVGRRAEAEKHLEEAMKLAAAATQVHWRIHQIQAEVAWVAGDRSVLAVEAAQALASHAPETPQIVMELSHYWAWRADPTYRLPGPAVGPYGMQMVGTGEELRVNGIDAAAISRRQ
jgi:tetratricopeptide (TPR) repeat protein